MSGAAEKIDIDGDLSWFLIAVGRKKVGGYRDCVVLDYADGWRCFDVEFYWEDTFTIDPPMHLAPGAYRWVGYDIGYLDEGAGLNVTGGCFEPFTPDAEQPHG